MPVLPLTLHQWTKEDLQNPDFFNTQWVQVINALNKANGAAGKTELPSGIDVKGQQVSNVGPPIGPQDAVSLAHAEANYSAAAISKQLEAGGGHTPKSMRILNSKSQQENFSTFLNGMMNTAPTANSSIVTSTAPSGGSVTVTVSAGYHYYPDGQKIVPYAQRSDTLALPSSFNISSISRSGNVVTLVTSSPTGFAVGSQFAVSGVADTSFDGTFVVATIAGSTITYNQIGPNASSSGGTVSENGCYYYYIRGASRMLALAGPFAADTQQNRISVNIDNTVLIAVVVLNSGGFDPLQSAAGATPPAATNNSRLLLRL